MSWLMWLAYVASLVGLYATDSLCHDHVWAGTFGYWCGVVAGLAIYRWIFS